MKATRIQLPGIWSNLTTTVIIIVATTTMMAMMMMMMQLTTVIPGATRRKVNTQIASTHSFDNFYIPNIAASTGRQFLIFIVALVRIVGSLNGNQFSGTSRKTHVSTGTYVTHVPQACQVCHCNLQQCVIL